jgi:hypothetical protein
MYRNGRLRMVSRSAPGNTNRVAVPYKDKDALIRARREAAQYGVAGARGGAYFNRNKLGSEDIFDPITGLSGGKNLVTTDYNPENIKYEQRTVPTIRGSMVSGGQPNIGNSFAGILEALKGSVNDRLNPVVNPIDAEIAEKARGNPLGLRAAMQNLTPEMRRKRENEQALLDREREYSNLLSTLKAAGITSEEELYRNAVVGPDGQVNLNPNAQAAIAQLGNAANSLRLLDLSGMGAGKAVSAGARVASRATVRGLDNLIPRIASVANNPTLINAGMDTVRAAAAGAPMEQSVATGLAGLVRGNQSFARQAADQLNLSRTTLSEIKAGERQYNVGGKVYADPEEGALAYQYQAWKNAGNKAGRKIVKSTEEFLNEWRASGLGRNEFLRQNGMYQSAGEAKPETLLQDFEAANPNITDDILEYAHDVAKAKGGPHTIDNVYLVPKRTNAAMKDKTFKEFVDEQTELTGKSADEVAEEWGILHTPYK